MIEQAMSAFSSLGESMLRWIAGMNAWTLAVLLGAVAIDWALRRRVGAAWRMALYAAVLLRVALPVAWASPLGVVGGTRGVDPPAGGGGPEQSAPIAVQYEFHPPTDGASAGAVGGATAGWPLVVPLVYVGGVATLMAAGIAGQARLRRVIAECSPADERVATMASPVPVLVHRVAGPMLVGFLHPRLVLPESTAIGAGPERLEWIITHERAHARRRDPWLALLIHLVTIAAWPIVPVWIAGSRLRALMEQACDERALAGRGEQARLSYAQTLIDAMTAPRRMVTGPLAAKPALEFGVGLRQRILAMRFTRRWRCGWQITTTTVAAAALVACAGTRHGSGGSDADAGIQTSAPPMERTVLLPQHDPRPIRLEFTLLDKWPQLPWLDATPDGRGPANGGIQMLYPGQHSELLEAATKRGNGVIASPTILTRPGQQAEIRIGGQVDAGGGEERSISIRAAASRNKGGFDLDIELTETGRDARTSGPVRALALRDHTEVIPIRESRPGQGGMLLLVRVSDEPESGVGWPIVFYRLNRVELTARSDFVRAVETSGGRKIIKEGAEHAADGDVAYTLPVEFVESLYDKLDVPDMQRFRLGHEQHIQAASSEIARCSLTSRPDDGRSKRFEDAVELRSTLAPPADRPGPVLGGSLSTGVKWTSPDGGIAIDVPAVKLADYDAAGHHLAIAAFWPGSPAERLPPRLLIVMPHRAGTEDDLPRQMMEVTPQTFTP